MSKAILIGYATRYGSTAEVAEKIASTMEEAGQNVEIHPLRDVKDVAKYSAVVMGAPLFMYRWHKDAKRFLSRHRKSLQNLPVAIFALGPTHDPQDKKVWRDSNDQLNKELERFPWISPVDIQMFGGKYAPEKLKAPLKWFAGSVPASDIRDWKSIHSWADGLAGKLSS
jgi:menaquinone-dependent protoporphyrinogen oxidase